MVKTDAMFMGWNYPRSGREKAAGEMFGAAVQFWTKHLQDKNITSFEPVMLTLHGGDMNGFFLIKGEPKKLDEIRDSEQFLKLVMQLNASVDGVGVVPAYAGESVGAMMAEWMKLLG